MEEKKTILLLNKDDSENLELTKFLKQSNIKCITATDYLSTIHLAKNNKIDLLLIDPLIDKDNYSNFIDDFNNNIHTTRIPIIIILDNKNTNLVEHFFVQGAIDYIIRPVALEEKIARLVIQLKLKKRESKLLKRIESNNRFQFLFKNSKNASVLIKDNIFVAANDSLVKMFGYSKKNEIVGKEPGYLSPKLQANNKNSVDEAKKMIDIAFKNGVNSFEWTHKKASGKTLPTHITLTAIPFNKKIIIHAVFIDLTKQKENEQNLKNSEKRYKALFDNSLTPMFLHKNDKIIMANREAAIFMETKNEYELVGKRVSLFINKKYRTEITKKIQNIHTKKKIEISEINVITSKGNKRIVKATGFLVDMEEGKTILSSLIDITEQKTIEKELKNKEEHYRNIFTRIPIALYKTDETGQIVDANPALVKMLKYPDLETLLKKNVTELVLKEDYRKNEIDLLKEVKEVNDYPLKLKRYDGSIILAQDSAVAIKDKINNTTYFEGHLIDISKRKKAERKFNKIFQETLNAKNLLRSTIDTTDDAIFAKNLNGEYIFSNKAYANLLNVIITEIKGKTDIELGYDPKKDNSETIFSLQRGKEHLENKTKYIDLNNRIKLDNGNILIFQTETVKLKDKKGKTFAYLFFAHNITRLMRAEEELQNININLEKIVAQKAEQVKATQKNFRQLFEKSHDTVLVSNEAGQIIDANQRICNLLGYSKSELLKMNITQLTNTENEVKRPGLIKEMRENDFIIFETINISKSGKKIPFEVNSTILESDNGILIVSIGRDITDRKETNKKILKAILKTEETERNRFAKELHDGLGALLSAIKMYVDVLSENKVSNDMIPEILNKTKDLIDEAAQSAREIANNIKPHVLTNLGFKKSVEILCNKFTNTGKININFNAESYNLILNKDFELNIYRIISELINNTIKHAKAKQINLILGNSKNTLFLRYSDDGVGFNVEKQLLTESKGNGVKNIYNRVETINGTCKIVSNKEEGTSARIKININDYIVEK